MNEMLFELCPECGSDVHVQTKVDSDGDLEIIVRCRGNRCDGNTCNYKAWTVAYQYDLTRD